MKDRTDPTNVDSVPAMLTPGEFVLNKEASQMYAKEAEAMNNHGLQVREAENKAVGMNTGGSLPTLPTAYNQGGFVDFLKKHEGWKDKAYKDSGGVWTIGFGRTTNEDGSKVKAGQSTTKKAENKWLDKRAKKDYDATSKYLKDSGYDFNDNQINALASFRYNGGQGMLEQLTDNGTRDLATIQAKMPLYNKAGGKAIEGLTNRRNAELELFNTPWEAPAEGAAIVEDDGIAGALSEAILGGGADKAPMTPPPMMEMPAAPGPLPGELVLPQNEQVMLPPPPPPTSAPPPMEEAVPGELGLGGLEQYVPPPPGHKNAVKPQEEAGWFDGVSDTFSNFFNNEGGLIHANSGRRVPKRRGAAAEFDPVAFLNNKKNSKQKGPGRGKKLQRTVAEAIKDAEDLSQDNQDTLKAFWQFLKGNSTIVPEQLEQKIDEVEEIIPDLEIPPAEENDLYQTFAGGYGDVPPTPKKGETPEEAQQRVWEQEDAADFNQIAGFLDQPDSGYLAGQEGVPYIPPENQDYNQTAGFLDQSTEAQQQNYGPEGFQNMIDPQLTGEGYQPEGFVDAVPSMGPQYAPEGFADAVPSMGPQYAPEGFTDAVPSMGPQYAPEGFTDAIPSQVAPDYAPEGFTDAIPSSYTPPEEFGRQPTADDMARENLAAIHEERKNDWIPLNEKGARQDLVGFNKGIRDLSDMPQQGVFDDTQNYGPEGFQNQIEPIQNYGPEGFQNQIEPQQIEAAIEEEEEAVRAETLGLPIPDTTNVDAVGDALQESMPVPQPQTFAGGRGEYTPPPQNYESSLAQNQIAPQYVRDGSEYDDMYDRLPQVPGMEGMAYDDLTDDQLQARANGGDQTAASYLGETGGPMIETAHGYNYEPTMAQNMIEPIQNFESSLAQNMIAPMQNYEPTMAQNQIAPMQNYEPTMAQNAPGYIQNYGPEGFQNIIEPVQIEEHDMPRGPLGGADAMARMKLKEEHERRKNDWVPLNEKGARQDVVGFNKQLRDLENMPQQGVVDDTQNYGPAGFQNQIEPQQNYESSMAQNMIPPNLTAMDDEELGARYDQGDPAAVAEVDRREALVLNEEKLNQNRLDKSVAGSEGDGLSSQGQKFLQQQEAALLEQNQALQAPPGLDAFGGTGIPPPGMDAFGPDGTVPLPEEGMGYDGVNAEGMSMYDEVITDAPVAKTDAATKLSIAQDVESVKNYERQMKQREEMLVSDLQNATSPEDIAKAKETAKWLQVDKESTAKFAKETQDKVDEAKAADVRADENNEARKLKEIEAADESQVKAWETAKELGIDIGPKPTASNLADQVDPKKPTTAESVQGVKDAIASSIAEQQAAGKEPEPDPTVEKQTEAKAAGDNATDEQKHEGFKAVKSAFGDMFDSKELGRMAVLFAGALLTGSSPGQALKFAGMNYIQRMDAKEDYRRKEFTAAAKTGEYTPASLAAYKKSGDFADLTTKIDKATYKHLGNSKTFYAPGGKRVLATQVEDQAKNKYWVDNNGDKINQTEYDTDPANVKGTVENDKIISDRAKELSTQLKEMKNERGKFSTEHGDSYTTDIMSGTGGRQAAEWAIENKIPVQAMGTLLENSFDQALKESSGKKAVKARRITAYLNDQWVRTNVGEPDLFKLGDGQSAAAKDVNSLMKSISATSGLQGSDISNTTTIMQKARPHWSTIDEDERKDYIKNGAPHGQSGFMYWLSKMNNDELKKFQ